MKKQRLPQTCSATWFSAITPWDDVKKELANALKAEKAMGSSARMSNVLCALVDNAVNKKLITAFKEAGFKCVVKYKSHNHSTTVLVLSRTISKKEFDKGEPKWPHLRKRKAVKR